MYGNSVHSILELLCLAKLCKGHSKHATDWTFFISACAPDGRVVGL
jgi:hypothetical protein